MHKGQFANALPEILIVTRLRTVVPGGSGNAHQEASPFGLDLGGNELPRCRPSLGGRHRLFWITSFMASISRRCCPTIFSRRAFSFSRRRSRLASSGAVSPYFFQA
jgi:hypothetical protein